MTVPPAPRRRNPWLLREPNPDATLLFCLPYPGTGASLYHRWPRRLGAVEVCPVQLPGRESRMREPSPESYLALAEELAEGLRPHLERPFGIFGHCGSVFLGYELALLLEREGRPPPSHFFASSAMAPHDAAGALILQIPEEDYRDVIETMMRARGVEPSPELAELSLDPLRADVRAHRGFRCAGTPLPCPFTAIAWSDDDQVPAWQVAGWRDYGDAELVVLRGTHWSFLEAPAELCERLEGALTPSGSRVPA